MKTSYMLKLAAFFIRLNFSPFEFLYYNNEFIRKQKLNIYILSGFPFPCAPIEASIILIETVYKQCYKESKVSYVYKL